jgi:hypothetical protein
MPPKPLEELTAVEIALLGIAARLQVAVKWVERHPPLPDKWAYLNAKVKDEIVGVNIVCHYIETEMLFRGV